MNFGHSSNRWVTVSSSGQNSHFPVGWEPSLKSSPLRPVVRIGEGAGLLFLPFYLSLKGHIGIVLLV